MTILDSTIEVTAVLVGIDTGGCGWGDMVVNAVSLVRWFLRV